MAHLGRLVPGARAPGMRCMALRMCSSVARQRQAKGHWEREENRRQFMEEMKQTFGIETARDWRQVGVKEMAERGGLGLLKRYHMSVFSLLSDVFPEEQLKAYECRSKVPKGYWDSEVTVRRFLEEVAKEKGVEKEEDWAAVSVGEIQEMGGTGMLSRYGSLRAALCLAFPEKAERLQEVVGEGIRPAGYWAVRENRRKKMDEIAAVLGVTKPEDWNDVSVRQVREQGAGTMLKQHSNSLFLLLSSTYPEVAWEGESCGKRIPRGYWEEEENRRQFLLRVAERHSVTTAEEWKRVEWKDVEEMGGKSLLLRYGSLLEALQSIFPEGFGGETWQAHLCRTRVPRGHWDREENALAFMEALGASFEMEKAEDWYRVSVAQIRAAGGARVLERWPLIGLLEKMYPGHQWSLEKLQSRTKKATQRQCFRFIQRFFPACHVEEDIRHVDLGTESRGADVKHSLELDIFVKQFQLAVEYNGLHHYVELPLFGPLEHYLRRDKEKAELCVKHGIRLLVVPAWWDEQPSSLAATLFAAYPAIVEQAVAELEHDSDTRKLLEDVMSGKHAPIASEPPQRARGFASLAPGHAPRLSAAVMGDPAGLMVCDYAGGLATHWEATDKALATKRGSRKVNAPGKWLALLPEVPVDGTLSTA